MSITLSKALDFPNNHAPTLDQSVRSRNLALTADRAEYSPSQSAYIKLPKIGFLHGNESFLSFSFKPTATLGTAAVMNLDSCAYSLIRSIELTHGTEPLVTQTNDAGRSWVAMRDYSSSSSNSNTINLGVHETNHTTGQVLTKDHTYNYSFCLPVSLIGSLSSQSFPLGWLGGGDVTLKITFSDFFSGVFISAATAASSAESFTISNVVYHAKVSQLDSSVDGALREAFVDAPLVIPSQEISIQSGIAQSGVGSVNQQITLPYSSCKGVAWWLTNSSVVNGIYNANKTGRATSTRTLGVLKDTYVSVAGEMVPQGGIKGLKSGTNTAISFDNGVCYGHVMRFMNNLSSASPDCIVPLSQYAKADTAIADIVGVTANNRGLIAVDFDRSDVDQSSIYQGLNTANSQCSVVMNFNTALAEAHNLYVMALYDCSFVLENGQMRRVV